MVMVSTNYDKSNITLLKNLVIQTGSGFMLHPDEYKFVVQRERADTREMKMMHFEGPGALPVTTESKDADVAAFQEGYTETSKVDRFAYHMPISWYLRRFAQKQVQFVNQAGNYLSRSAKLRFEYTGMSPMNNGFTAGAYAGQDTKAFYASDHTFKVGGTYSNLFTAADFSKTTFESALKTVANAKMENNIPASLTITQLTVQYVNIMKAPELLKSTLDPESGNNTINAIREWGIKQNLNHYQSDTDQWTLDTNVNSRTMYIANQPALRTFLDDRSSDLYVEMDATIGSGFHHQIGSYSNAGS